MSRVPDPGPAASTVVTLLGRARSGSVSARYEAPTRSVHNDFAHITRLTGGAPDPSLRLATLALLRERLHTLPPVLQEQANKSLPYKPLEDAALVSLACWFNHAFGIGLAVPAGVSSWPHDLISSTAPVGMDVEPPAPQRLADLLRLDAGEWRGLSREIGFTPESSVAGPGVQVTPAARSGYCAATSW